MSAVGTCPVCGRVVELARDKYRVHKRPAGGWCPGGSRAWRIRGPEDRDEETPTPAPA